MSGTGILAWIIILGIFFLVLFLYPTFSTIVADLDKQVRNISEVSNSTDATGALDINATIWQYWPFLLAFGLILWAFYVSTKREPVWRGYE